jgi:hypothetical protein
MRRKKRFQRRSGQPHNYVKKIATMGNLSPGLHYCSIAHDDWCDFLNGRGECNCNPDITLKAIDTTEEYFGEVKNYKRKQN